jgi:hypothetical protein
MSLLLNNFILLKEMKIFKSVFVCEWGFYFTFGFEYVQIYTRILIK